jgi:hypothetical protein
MAGRFLNRHKRCIREEDYESNNRLIDKVVLQMSQTGCSSVIKYVLAYTSGGAAHTTQPGLLLSI